MKEIDLFESWLNSINEGVESVLPTSTQSQQELLGLLSKPFPVGADATNSTEELNPIFMNPELRDALYSLSQVDPNADARPIVLSQLSDYKNQPGIATIISKVSNSTASGESPAEPTPAPGSEEAINAPSQGVVPPPVPPAPMAPPAPMPGTEAPMPPTSDQTAPIPPTPMPGAAPDELAQQPVAEDSDYEYDQDLEQILKHAGVKTCSKCGSDNCNCPATTPKTDKSRLKEGRFYPFDKGHNAPISEGSIAHAIGSAGGGLGGAATGALGGAGVASVPLAAAGGAAGATVGGAALDAATEKWLETETAQSLRQKLSDAAMWLGQQTGKEGWGEFAKGLIDHQMTADSSEELIQRLQDKAGSDAAFGALGGLGKIAQAAKTLSAGEQAAGAVAADVAPAAAKVLGSQTLGRGVEKGAEAFSTLSPTLQKVLSAAGAVGTSATIKYGSPAIETGMDVYNQINAMPNGPELAKELLGSGWEGLKDPKTREALASLAGKAMTSASQGVDVKDIVTKAATDSAGAIDKIAQNDTLKSLAKNATPYAAGAAALGLGAKALLGKGDKSTKGSSKKSSSTRRRKSRTSYGATSSPTQTAKTPQVPTQAPTTQMVQPTVMPISQLSPSNIAPSAEFVQGHSADLGKTDQTPIQRSSGKSPQTRKPVSRRPIPRKPAPRIPASRKQAAESYENVESVEESINTSEFGLGRLITLAGLVAIKK